MNRIQAILTLATAATKAMLTEPSCCGDWNCSIRRGFAVNLKTAVNGPGEPHADFTLIVDERKIALNNGSALPTEVQPERVADAIITLTSAVFQLFRSHSGDKRVINEVEMMLKQLDGMLRCVQADLDVV